MRGLSAHIKREHNITSQEYYDMFFGKGYCSLCGKPTKFHNLTLGYYKRCSRGCANKLNTHIQSVKQSKLEKYGNSGYNNPQKISESLQKRTDYDIKQSYEKTKTTKLVKYGNSTYNNQIQRMETLLKNNTIKISKSEQYCYDKLKLLYPNTKYQYYDNRYPYFCDFYVPELDLFIELHFTWLHGNHRYNEIQDKDKFNLWKEKAKTSDYYKKAIYIWTVNDEQKYQVAEQNKLNYKTFYNKQEFDNWFITLLSQIHGK